jgi:hypothetical protein
MDIKVRLARPEESELAVEWLSSTEKNLFDPNVLSYKSTMTLCAENGKPSFFIPVQLCFFLESIGKRPDIRKREMAYSLVKFLESIRKIAKEWGIGEAYFFCKDESINEQAAHFGFESVMQDKEKGWQLFRMRTQ